MPFGSYQVSPEDAVRSAIRLVKEGGVAAVKLEGGVAVRGAIERIVAAEIPVMGHVGLTPQSVHRMGGYRVQGRGEAGRARVLDDARAVEDAGAFAVVLEGMPAELAREITASLSIPTIGIGAGAACDGQVLVLHDLLGLSEWTPSFAKQYAGLGALASQAARAFADEVRAAQVPRPGARVPLGAGRGRRRDHTRASRHGPTPIAPAAGASRSCPPWAPSTPGTSRWWRRRAGARMWWWSRSS